MSQLDDRSVTEDHEVIMSLDPLDADEVYRKLPDVNREGDVAALIETLRTLAERARGPVAAFSRYEAVAATRDLGFILGSIKRLGLEPVQVVPEVEPVLLALRDLTGMVPRETVYHYSIWNPTGRRQRSFTGDPQEDALIASVRLSLAKLAGAVARGPSLHELPLLDPQFASSAKKVADGLQGLEESIDLVIREVSPVFFARVLRPYFDDVRIGEERYTGGAGAGLPVPLIDLILWASDQPDPAYEAFWRGGVPYTLPAWQRLYDVVDRQPSMVTRLVTALRTVRPSGTVPRDLQASALAIERCLRALVIFRAKHLTIARKAYQADLRLYSVGSSGGDTDLLDRILLSARDNVTLVRDMGYFSREHGVRGTGAHVVPRDWPASAAGSSGIG
ncbi:MAG: monodechloroaminopyrrolnitrin synthase PrnB family protein [Micromonosporaceae bacterium]